MKKIASIVMCSLMILSSLIATISPEVFAAGGIGTVGDPYIIENVWELQNMSLELGANYTLGNDIDASITSGWNFNGTAFQGFLPIGDNVSRFNGSLNGNNYTISNLHITNISAERVGLFGVTESIAWIHHVDLDDVNISGYHWVGSLVGVNYGSIENCSTDGIVNCTGENIGGLVGYNIGDIDFSTSNCIVNGSKDVGGLVGEHDTGTISNSHASGDVDASGAYAGGLVGKNIGGTISNCYYTGNISGTNHLGGIVGYNDAGTITGVVNHGKVAGISWVGGIVGTSSNGHIIDAVNYGNVSGNYRISGIAGANVLTSTITDAVNNGNVTGINDYVAGIAGDCTGTGFITDVINYGDVGSNGVVGGIVGRNYRPLTNATNYGNISANYDNLGGIIGQNYGAVDNATNYGNVTGSDDNVGGLIGYSTSSPVTNSTNFGDVFNPAPTTGNYYGTGGLIGKLGGSTVSFSESYGNVSGCKFFTGGLIGDVASGATIINCSSYGVSTGSSGYIGGLVGNNEGTIFNCSVYGYTGNNKPWTGGLVGMNRNSGLIQNSSASGDVLGSGTTGGFVGENQGTIERCFSTGDVIATSDRVGGFVGRTNGNFVGVITDCYSHGDVTGDNDDGIGGFVGNHSYGASITNVYSTGLVTGILNTGGLIGTNWASTVNDSHWDMETSGQAMSINGTGHDMDEMMQQATFTNWDFTDIWGIHEANTYPFLLSFGVPPEPVADMEITLADSVDLATVGEIFSYFLTLENHGPDNAANLYVNITLPPEVTYHSSNETMDVDGRYISGDVFTFESGEVGGVQINVILNSYGSGELNCTAFVTSSTADIGVYANDTYELTAVNRPPIAEDKNYQATEDYPDLSWAPGVLWNADDLDGDPIEVVSYENSDFGANITIDADGNFTYDPTVSAELQALHGGMSVNDTFNYTISDGRGGFTTALITVQVDGIEGAPSANTDNFTVAEDDGPYILDVLANDVVDEEGDAFNITHSSGAIHGTLTVSADGLVLTYTPYNTNYTGSDVFSYMITDGIITDVANVNLTITPVNDAPRTQQGGVYHVDEDSVATTIDVLPKNFDGDGDELTIITVTQPDNGIVVIIESGKNVTYEPDANFFGKDFFNYTISDGNNGTATIMIYMVVDSVNDEPIIITTALPDGIRGVAYTFALNATDIDSALSWGSGTTVEWLQVDSSGYLVGTPDAAGIYTVHIVVNDADGGIVHTNLTLNVTEPGTDTDGDGWPDTIDDDDDGDGTLDDLDAFPLDDTETTDTDADGIGDNGDAFPTDPAASVDVDGDGYPDEWNPGYTADDSTTGLVLADNDDDESTNNWLYIILILIVVGIIAGLAIMKGKGKKPMPDPETETPVEEATEEVPE